MRKLLLLLLITISSIGFSQYSKIYNPSDPAPDVTLCGGPYAFVNFVEYAEFGAMGLVNFKDIFMVGPYYQYSVRDNHFYGLYTQINVIPKSYYFTLGAGLRTGFINDTGKLSIEGGMTIQHNTMSDKIKFIHQIGFTRSTLHYGFGVLFGNFGQKYWKNPNWENAIQHRQSKQYQRALKYDL